MGCCLCIAVVIAVILLVVKLFVKLTTGWDRSATCLVGKTAVVTGANTGIGFFTAQDLAKRGARVVLACRDKNRAEDAKKKIIEATGNPNIVVRLVDFASLASVRAFAKEINTTEERLDILVNNAGAGGFADTTTEDGLNTLMQINYFGPFLLTLLLVDLVKKSAPSRIVNVSSTAAKWAQLNPNNLNEFPKVYFDRTINYANTKLGNILFTNELARKLKGSGVVTNSLHPGAVNTEIFRRAPALMRFAIQTAANVVLKTSEEGAQTSIFVAVSKDIEGVSGEYFSDCKIAGMPKAAKDEGLAKKVWEKSEELVKLTAAERVL